MTREELARANKINREIIQLEKFIDTASNVWTGKLISRNIIETKHLGKFIFRSSPYGIISSAEYEMDTKTKNNVLQVLRDKLKELNNELLSIGKEV